MLLRLVIGRSIRSGLPVATGKKKDDHTIVVEADLAGNTFYYISIWANTYYYECKVKFEITNLQTKVIPIGLILAQI
jgi:hypothetical protein